MLIGNVMPVACPSETTLISVKDLRTHIVTRERTVRAVDGVSFELRRGEALGLVGESGCGKSMTCLSIVKLLPERARIVSGSVVFEGKNLAEMGESQLMSVRGAKIGFIFQEPLSALNPYLTVGTQLCEGIRRHSGHSERTAMHRAAELLASCGIVDSKHKLTCYPHQFSGGMRQRVMIAIALSCGPSLVIADEPTTALDTVTQRQILELLKAVKKDEKGTGRAFIMVTHDLGVAAEVCDRIAVMYAGSIVENGPVREVFERPAHPYTRGLLAAIPRMGRGGAAAKLEAIAGEPPDLSAVIEGCPFRPRCGEAKDACAVRPEMTETSPVHFAACHFVVKRG
jgi:oligopeptide/dipeptide ABC transporter ATP-binding protein